MKKLLASAFLFALLFGSTVAAFATDPSTSQPTNPWGPPDRRGPIDPVPPTSAPPPPSK